MKREEKNWLQNKLVSGNELKAQKKSRRSDYLSESISLSEIPAREKNGWIVCKRYKQTAHVNKKKPQDMAFEDHVWNIFSDMGFNCMNKNRKLELPYDKSDVKLTQQIDVFAVDDECVLLIECKSASEGPKCGNFKKAIEAIGGFQKGIVNNLKKYLSLNNHKFKWILATNNYYLSPRDKDRLKEFNILHFDENVLEYYKELAKHLGSAAKFQLLANIFRNSEIPGIANQIPAISGRMGGHKYYSFSIEPEKLLKISYVLHRSKANSEMMPTYQRLIKKNRLQSIQQFINEGGFFPNSIVVNIDTKRPLQFNPATPQVEGTESKIGILHLPKKYGSAYIIDGQHRLYGYTDSKYSSSNTIPVVLFVNLSRQEQVKLFMQINENQKAVSKNLRNTLNSDLLWSDENKANQIIALKLHLAQKLGETKDSPLYDRVLVGEAASTLTKCISIDSIKIGLDYSNFFNVYVDQIIRKHGTFDCGNNEETAKLLYSFLIGCFRYVQENLPKEWNQGKDNSGYLTINAGIISLLRIFNDITDTIVYKEGLDPKSVDIQTFLKSAYYYLDPLLHFLQTLPPEEKLGLKGCYGTGGRTKYWRILQKAIHSARPEFIAEGLDEYWKDQSKMYNAQSCEIIYKIKEWMGLTFKNALIKKYGEDDWLKLGIPKPVFTELHKRAIDINYQKTPHDPKIQPWECMQIGDYRKIALYGDNWSSLFEKICTIPGEEKLFGGKDKKTNWIKELDKIAKQDFINYSVTKDEFDFLLNLEKIFI